MTSPLETETKTEQKMGNFLAKKHPHPQMGPTSRDETYNHLQADRPLKQVHRRVVGPCMMPLETIFEDEEEMGTMYTTNPQMGPTRPDETYDPLRANSIIRIQPSIMANRSQSAWMSPSLETIKEEDEEEIGNIIIIQIKRANNYVTSIDIDDGNAGNNRK